MKKASLILVIMMMALILSSCTMFPASMLESMFQENSSSSVSSGIVSSPGVGDTVMISRSEYEKYQKFDEMFTIFDDANQNYYQEIDPDQLIEYATRGLMALFILLQSGRICRDVGRRRRELCRYRCIDLFEHDNRDMYNQPRV